MKKLSLLAIALLITTSAFAQQRDNRNAPNISIQQRGPVIRINVGDERDDREMLKRIVRLERAVADLQDKVFELSTRPVAREVIVCSAKFFSAGNMTATSLTEKDARTKLLIDCKAKTNEMFCNNSDISCYTSYEN